ncbi:hypothetical protein BDN72DRAFT_901501 [Pluteus cervinus]|uniref:Uncharacterized protein n=1 Tax=Pluteus cervinus TaxID=181527 RepID=A0ACD3AGS5_9AGAR|nr:hypothetical protein BDN72DRAFT_901501 [Pluteus cervinus]
MNTTSDCDFSSLNDVLNQAAIQNTNLTDLVQKCQNICGLVWGTGNPDLSGIGAEVSYIIQVIFVVIFGPLFSFLYGLRGSPKDSSKSPLVKLHDAFVDSNAVFTISISIAALVRIKQDAPLYELSFLLSLTSMQFLGLLTVIITSMVTNPREEQDETKKRIRYLIMYSLLDFGLYAAFLGLLQASQNSWASGRELGVVCQGYGTILPGFTSGKPVYSTTAEVIGLLLAGLSIAIVAYLAKREFTTKKPLHLGIIIVSLGLTSGTIFFLVQMQHRRDVMKSLAGSDFVDNEWGFGQVLALFIWVSFLIDGI